MFPRKNTLLGSVVSPGTRAHAASIFLLCVVSPRPSVRISICIASSLAPIIIINARTLTYSRLALTHGRICRTSARAACDSASFRYTYPSFTPRYMMRVYGVTVLPSGGAKPACMCSREADGGRGSHTSIWGSRNNAEAFRRIAWLENFSRRPRTHARTPLVRSHIYARGSIFLPSSLPAVSLPPHSLSLLLPARVVSLLLRQITWRVTEKEKRTLFKGLTLIPVELAPNANRGLWIY